VDEYASAAIIRARKPDRSTRRGHVIALDHDPGTLGWTRDSPAVDGLTGDATDEQTLGVAVARASRVGTLTGWVNNAAVFRDAAAHDTPIDELLDLITANVALAVAGSTAAIRCFC
jgi:NAD(P)-dependent dehydrogenase (short-subunit alcohol dehydrogenase family)